jgi:peptidoglycan hydrolase CwlO-like protein
MHKLILVLFTSLIFLATTSYAEQSSIETLQAQMAEIQSKLKELQKSNGDIKKTLASRENEIDGWRLALENIEAEIAALASGE